MNLCWKKHLHFLLVSPSVLICVVTLIMIDKQNTDCTRCLSSSVAPGHFGAVQVQQVIHSWFKFLRVEECVHLLLEYGDVVDVIAALSWIDECHFQQARLCSWVYHRPCITTNNSYLTLPVRGHEMEPCGTRKNILPIQHEKMKMILQVFPSQRLPFVLNKQRWEWNDFDVVPKFFVGWSSSF